MKEKHESVYLAKSRLADQSAIGRGIFFKASSRRNWSKSRRERAAERDRRLLGGSATVAAFLIALFLFRPGGVRTGEKEFPFRERAVVSQEAALPGRRSAGNIKTSYDESASTIRERKLPVGLSGIMRGLSYDIGAGTRVPRVGLRAERVQVGQRFQSVLADSSNSQIAGVFSQEILDQADRLMSLAASIPENAYLATDLDYENLLKIVEAEAGTEDIKGRILVANVILNRVRHPEFPDTVTDVIYHYDNGVAQFSPVMDGRIYDVAVSAGTRQAVRLALEGTDYSQGALFFIQKDIADEDCTKWFEENLHFLFKYGVHEFYCYPDAGKLSRHP